MHLQNIFGLRHEIALQRFGYRRIFPLRPISGSPAMQTRFTLSEQITMRKLSKPATSTAAKPAVAKPAARKLATVKKPGATKAAAADARKPAPVTVAPVTAPATEAKPRANITRTAATIAAQRTNFGDLSDRDNAYLAFYGSLARATGHRTTVAAIVESGKRPDYNGSNKPHDAGVIVRLCKAGLAVTSDNGNAIAFTPKAQSLAAYTGRKA